MQVPYVPMRVGYLRELLDNPDLNDRALYAQTSDVEGHQTFEISGIDTETFADAIILRIEPTESLTRCFDPINPDLVFTLTNWDATVHIKREIVPALREPDNDEHRFGLEFYEDGTMFYNIWFPNAEVRARYYEESIKPDPDKYFEDANEFNKHIERETERHAGDDDEDAGPFEYKYENMMTQLAIMCHAYDENEQIVGSGSQLFSGRLVEGAPFTEEELKREGWGENGPGGTPDV